MATTIPPITDPAGDYWEQPKPEDIKFVLGHAWVSRVDFNKLKNYTATNPTGAYIGKMWKRQTNTGWWLMWYGEHPNPCYCNINKIQLMIDEKIINEQRKEQQ